VQATLLGPTHRASQVAIHHGLNSALSTVNSTYDFVLVAFTDADFGQYEEQAIQGKALLSFVRTPVNIIMLRIAFIPTPCYEELNINASRD
jgi:hypothetical protein